MWKGSRSTGDYHNQMNFENYEKWLMERLIPNLQSNSVTTDNVPYHNVFFDSTPSLNKRG
jgi:hypothetical protein